MFNFKKLFAKTPDQELAAAVRQAASDYNTALEAAKAAGLQVQAEAGHYYWGNHSDWIGDRHIRIRRIARESTQIL